MATKLPPVPISEVQKLRDGEMIRVRFGSFGSQVAVVQGSPLPSGAVYVRKFRAKTQRWTGIVRVHPNDIVQTGHCRD